MGQAARERSTLRLSPGGAEAGDLNSKPRKREQRLPSPRRRTEGSSQAGVHPQPVRRGRLLGRSAVACWGWIWSGSAQRCSVASRSAPQAPLAPRSASARAALPTGGPSLSVDRIGGEGGRIRCECGCGQGSSRLHAGGDGGDDLGRLGDSQGANPQASRPTGRSSDARSRTDLYSHHLISGRISVPPRESEACCSRSRAGRCQVQLMTIGLQ